MFSNTELADIHFIYGFCDGNAAEAQREYERRFPNRRIPDRRTFINSHRRLTEHGSFNIMREGAGRHRGLERVEDYVIVNIEEQILNSIRADPTISTRRLGLQLGISHHQVWEVISREGLHPYHRTPVQDLLPADLPLRVNFARTLLRHHEQDPLFLASICWTDEAQFTRDGITNLHNVHYWAEDNPHLSVIRSSQHRFSLNVWAAIINRNLIGPIFIPQRLNGGNYLQHLRETIPIIEDEAPISVLDRIIYQHDGAPAHSTNTVKNYLNRKFNRRLIARSDQNVFIRWPPRSPDLTPMDFFLWSVVKDKVYSERINSEEQLQQRIVNAFNDVNANMETVNLCVAVERRCNLCIIQNGAHFENFL